MAALSPSDPNSYSRPDIVKTTHVHLEVEVDFEKKILVGSVRLTLEKVDLQADSVILDARSLTISRVYEEDSGQTLDYTYGSPSGFGEKLEIKLPAGSEKKLNIRVEYTTSPEATALQWLSPSQTAGKKHPYMFSQCQAESSLGVGDEVSDTMKTQLKTPNDLLLTFLVSLWHK